MQPQATAGRGPLCVARGYGISIHVRYGHLLVEDGAGRDRRVRRYARASSKLKRLVLIGHSGFATLEALRWLHDQNAALLHFDADGQLLTTSTLAGRDTPALRRGSGACLPRSRWSRDRQGTPESQGRGASLPGR